MRRLVIAALILATACGPAARSDAAASNTPTAIATPVSTPRLVLDVPAESPTLRTYTVVPADTDAAIPASAAPHFVAFDSGVAPRGQLFLMMAGNAVLPADNTLIVRQAAANGFHAIALDYARDVKVPTVCELSPDETCYEKVRLAIIDGGDRSPLVNITQANSITNRLAKLLAYLAVRSPNEGWSAYLANGAPRWSSIRLGGQSEGGTHAALVARDREVARVCLLEAPVDLISLPGTERRIAPWITPARATPADRYFGFRHLHSSSPLAPAFALSYAAIGLDRFGAPANADTAKPPYGGTHLLTTDLDPINDGQANLSHRSVVQDRPTPRTASGQPAFAPVWQYACFS